eukprot:354633-Chlamydomonas_euryale.AAC.19
MGERSGPSLMNSRPGTFASTRTCRQGLERGSIVKKPCSSIRPASESAVYIALLCSTVTSLGRIASDRDVGVIAVGSTCTRKKACSISMQKEQHEPDHTRQGCARRPSHRDLFDHHASFLQGNACLRYQVGCVLVAWHVHKHCRSILEDCLICHQLETHHECVDNPVLGSASSGVHLSASIPVSKFRQKATWMPVPAQSHHQKMHQVHTWAGDTGVHVSAASQTRTAPELQRQHT